MSVGGSIRVENEYSDKFPVGMRVLAVDDDPTCLKLLECLLKKCHYHVTVTNQARVALEMLRENKDRFDLVISDVHMPDMDGFKLLELVGLEMDLPVIMLSANSDTRVVMKGVTHGACDYLVKPVRVEELQNIWQHVIRRKKFNNPKHHGKSDDVLPGDQLSGSAEQNEKHNKRRKDDEEEEESDDRCKNEDSVATQKKARVVWSVELHRKFVAAVNQLGFERAVPKRILDLMNVEGLTRDNVASHLQKYRLYLKRISLVSTPQANMPTGSGDGFGDFRALAGPGPLNNDALSSSYAPGSRLGRLNSSAGLGFQNVNSLGLIQPSHSLDPLGKLNSNARPTSQNPSLFQGTQILSGSGSPINAMILQGNSRQGQPGGGFGYPQSLTMTSLRPEPLNTGINHGNLQNSILASNYNPLMETHSQLGQNHVRANYSSAGSHLPGSPLGYTSTFSTGPNQFWGQNQNSSSGVPVKGIMPSLSPSGGQNNNNDIFNMEMDTSLIGQVNGGSMALFQNNENRNLNQDSTMKSNEDPILNSTTAQDGFESLDDLIMNEVAKEGQNGQFGFDAYSFGP